MHSFNVIFKNSILFIVTCFITLIFLEVFLRTSEIILPSFVYDDPLLGRTHKPNALVSLIGAEGFYMGKINKFGFVGKPYNKEKDKDVFRIVLIGDSYIEGFQLFERNHFSTYMQQKLKKIKNKRVEVLNFGIGGIDLRGMYLRFQKLAKEYHPDMTLFFIREEDLVKKDVLPTPEAYILNDSIAFSKSYLNTSDSRIRKKFEFVRAYSIGNLLKEVFEVYHNGFLLNRLLGKLYPQGKSETQAHDKIYSITNDKFYAINKKILEALSSNTNEKYHPVIVQIEDYPPYYNKLLKKLGVRIFLLKDKLKIYSKKDLNFWKASKKLGHWNHFAHKVVGEFLADSIKNMNIVKVE